MWEYKSLFYGKKKDFVCMIRKNTMIYLLDMTMNKILQEIKKFSLENWWIYIIFFICIFII